MKLTHLILLLALANTIAFSQTKTSKPASSAKNSNVYHMEEGFVDAHGVLIYYKIIGHGASLMIVHGGIAASTLVIVSQAGHMAFVDQPKLYIEKVTEFLQGKL